MKEKKFLKLFGLICAVVTLAVLVGLGFTIKKMVYLSRNFVKIDAVITEVYDEEGCELAYSYNGRDYLVSQTEFYSPSFDEGEIIKIYIDPYYPPKIEFSSENTWLIIGLVFFGLIAGFFAVYTLKKSCFKKVNRDWDYVYAKVVDVILNENIIVNGVCPFQIKCRYVNPSTGEEKIFYSDNCFDDPGMIYRPNEPIKVYVKDETMKEYTVDLSKMSEYKLG